MANITKIVKLTSGILVETESLANEVYIFTSNKILEVSFNMHRVKVLFESNSNIDIPTVKKAARVKNAINFQTADKYWQFNTTTKQVASTAAEIAEMENTVYTLIIPQLNITIDNLVQKPKQCTSIKINNVYYTLKSVKDSKQTIPGKTVLEAEID